MSHTHPSFFSSLLSLYLKNHYSQSIAQDVGRGNADRLQFPAHTLIALSAAIDMQHRIMHVCNACMRYVGVGFFFGCVLRAEVRSMK